MADKNLVAQLKELEEKILEELVTIYSRVRGNHPIEHNCLIVLNDYEAQTRRVIKRLFEKAATEK